MSEVLGDKSKAFNKKAKAAAPELFKDDGKIVSHQLVVIAVNYDDMRAEWDIVNALSHRYAAKKEDITHDYKTRTAVMSYWVPIDYADSFREDVYEMLDLYRVRLGHAEHRRLNLDG